MPAAAVRSGASRMRAECDIAIVGGGLVGASLAVAMADRGRNVVLVERALPFEGGRAWDERCIALNDASRQIFKRLGVWGSLAAESSPILATHISERSRFGVVRINAVDNGLDALGFNVPVRAIAHVLWERIKASQVKVFCPALLTAIRPEKDGVTLHVSAEEGAAPEIVLRTRLVAAADGAQSVVRKRLGIRARVHDYGQQAIVTAARISRPHHGVAYERFTGEGIFAALPKGLDTCSLVWTVCSRYAPNLTEISDDAYLHQAQEVFGGRLGRFSVLGRRVAFPLMRVISQESVALRTLLLGNAAQNLHPVAAQGFNLGLRDVAVLADLTESAEDPGSSSLLDEYVNRRARDRAAVTDMTHTIVRTFTSRMPALAYTRHLGLVGLGLFPAVRKRVIRQHLGYLGLPVSR